MISEQAIAEFDKDDVELTVPAGSPRPLLIIVMGPASCGKSTIGQDLSSDLRIPFIDGDKLHPQSNIDKMTTGVPLTDDDRLPWLALIRSTAERICRDQHSPSNPNPPSQNGLGRAAVIIACSALKKWYRDILRGEVQASPPKVGDLPNPTSSHPEPLPPNFLPHLPATSNLHTIFLYCHGSPEVLAQRIANRKNHFMGAQMLESQLAILEDPRNEGGVVVVEIDQREEDVARDAAKGVKECVEREIRGLDP